MAGNTPLQFSLRIEVLAQTLGENLNEGIKRLASGIDTDVVMSTPVDTGRARGNWIVTLNQPHEGFDYEKKSPGGVFATKEAQGIIASRQPGDDIYIVNNLDYIGALNDGHSPQAPPYYVQIAIIRQLSRFGQIQLLR